MNKGVVKFFDEEKGFGFITETSTREDFFVHISGVNDGKALQVDDEVIFEITEGRKGIIAVNVEVMKLA